MMSKDPSLEWFMRVKMKEGCNVIGGMLAHKGQMTKSKKKSFFGNLTKSDLGLSVNESGVFAKLSSFAK